MHFKDDPISDMLAKNYLIILCLKHFGPTKFGSVFWSRLFRRGPVEYNYPIWIYLAVILEDEIFSKQAPSFQAKQFITHFIDQIKLF